jgi:SNF2 family DNA or RNA helicase
MVLRPYQEVAADFLYGQDRAMILAPVGAGKTAITLTALSALLKIKRNALVLAPKRVAENVWATEAAKWAPELTVAVAVGTPKQRQKAFESGAQVVVTNYDNIQSLPHLDFDCIIFDELTRLKNPYGARFKALVKLIHHIEIRWGLTGSFTSNGLEDVYGQCKIIDQTLLGRSKGAFLQQYFIAINPEFGQWTPRAGSLEHVMERIKPATYVLEPGEYRDKLPPLHIVHVDCQMPMDHYNKLKKEFVLDNIVAVNAGVVTGKLQQMASGFVYDTHQTPDLVVRGKFITHQTPIWFSKHKFEALDDLLSENQHANTILVYQYQEELMELHRRYSNLVTLDDDDAIGRWNAGQIELLAIHPKSAGHGLNLQHGGCKMVFVSLPWSLELFEQTVGRLHRSGQLHDVWVYIMSTQKTIDEKIWSALQDKRAISDIAMEALK